MLIDREGNTTIITREKASVIELVKKIRVLYPKMKNDNIIIALSSLGRIKLEEIIEFLQISNEHRGSKQSFVLVTNNVNFDEIPDELVVVPTMREAFDIIEMEEMERDLGL